LVEGDEGAICAQLPTDAQSDPPFPLSLGATPGGSCEEGLALRFGQPGRRVEREYGDVPTEVVKESADQATVRTLNSEGIRFTTTPW
jgi:hypothetical protein